MATVLSVAYEFLADGQIAIHDERWLTYPWGVRGGDPGMRSTKRIVRIVRIDGSEDWLPAKCDGIDVKAGDVLYFNTWGGGGWGKPMERDPAAVLADVNRGLVTREGAKRYCVVINDKNDVDDAATIALRATMESERGDMGLFSRGGSIEEIKARALEETHLPPPESPHA